jgi:hypothetical protein
MGVLDEIAKLKQARRDEIAAAEEARRQAEEAAKAAFIQRLNAEAERILGEQGLTFLAALSAGVATVWDRQGRAQVNFEIPGHQTIGMQLRRYSIDPDQWRLTSSTVEGTLPWSIFAAGGGETSFNNFADALIAAEIPGWTPPAEPVADHALSPEAEHQAREAWAAMVNPDVLMPPIVALGMVEVETGGDQDDAVSALHYAAGEWLDALRPEQPVHEIADGYFGAQLSAAIACRGYLIGEEYNLADNCRLEVHSTCRQIQHDYDTEAGDRDEYGEEYVTTTQHDMNTASAWIAWCGYAATAIDLCRAVAAAAHPAPATSGP